VLAEWIRLGAQMPDQLVGRGHDVHRGPAPGPAPQDLRATERDAELPSLSQEDALRCFPQAGSLKFGCVHDYSNIHAGDGNRGY